MEISSSKRCDQSRAPQFRKPPTHNTAIWESSFSGTGVPTSMKLSRRFNILHYMLVQNRILTAEPLRALRIYFLFGGEYRQTKTCSYRGISVSWAFSRLEIACICSRREEVSDPIAVSRWDQKEPSLCALCDSAVNLIRSRWTKLSFPLARCFRLTYL